MNRNLLWTIVPAMLAHMALQAQYAPAAGFPGSDAIAAGDSRIVEWASGCTLQRGWQDIATPALGLASVGDESSALGRAGMNGIVSLGDGGMATLTFDRPVYNADGSDFAVFENGFSTDDSGSAFLELAFVEVSSDGSHFFRFPAVSHIQDTAQLAMVGVNCSALYNLAGKYVYGYGTPFDLEELKNEPGLDVNHITHIRVVDVVGAVNPLWATYDSEGHKVNDPYPTPFSSGGFDLDAVGVLHAVGTSSIGHTLLDQAVSLYPNPVQEGWVTVRIHQTEPFIMKMTDVQGNVLLEQADISNETQWSVDQLPAGVYVITGHSAHYVFTRKLIVK